MQQPFNDMPVASEVNAPPIQTAPAAYSEDFPANPYNVMAQDNITPQQPNFKPNSVYNLNGQEVQVPARTLWGRPEELTVGNNKLSVRYSPDGQYYRVENAEALPLPSQYNQLQEAQNTIAALLANDELLESAGTYAKYTADILPSSTAGSLNYILKEIKAAMSLITYKDIKAMGGGLGNATEKEWQMLEQALASIDVGMNSELLREKLNDVYRRFDAIQGKTTATPNSSQTGRRPKNNDELWEDLINRRQ
jgi:hypothetical protein